MKLKNKNLTLLKSLSLSEKQRNLKHSKQKILKRSLFQLFQLSLFVSAFALQAPVFEFNSSFENKFLLSKLVFKANSSFESAPFIPLKVDLFKFNTASADDVSCKGLTDDVSCKDSDNLSSLNNKLTRLETKLMTLNNNLSKNLYELRNFQIKKRVCFKKSKKTCEEKIEAKINTAKEELKDKYNCTEGDSKKEIKEKLNKIEVNQKKAEESDRSDDNIEDFDKFRIATSSKNADRAKFRDYLDGFNDKCNRLQGEKENCKKAKDSFDNTKSDFRRSCGKFSKSGGINCEEFILGCAVCPTPEEKDSSSYNCVKIHNNSKCPELAGPELEEARKLIKDFQEDLEEEKDELQDLQKDLIEEENELNRELVDMEEEFTSTVSDFKRDTDNNKKELENQFSENKQSISASLNEQIAEVQEMIDKKLAISHGFENALTKANRTYSLEVQRIQRECRQEAMTKLMNYRDSRRRAIENGSYSISFSQLISKKRVTFHEQDQNLLKYYNRFCLKDRKQELENANTNYKIALRGIEQQKEQFEDNINSMKSRLSDLASKASSAEKNLVQSYVKQMSGNINRFETNYKNNLKTYNTGKQSLIFTKSKKINRLKGAIVLKGQAIQELEGSLSQQRGLEGYLKSSGTSKEEDRQDDFADLTGAFASYESARQKNWDKCNCEDNYDSNSCPNKKEFESFRKRQKESSGRR